MGMDENRIDHDLKLTVAKHEYRLKTIEKIVEQQIETLRNLEKKFTIIGSLIIGTMLASSEMVGQIIRLFLG